MYRALGHAHAALTRLHDRAGQGTVEYVALILLVALVMAGVVAGLQQFQTDEGTGLAEAIIGKIRSAVRRVDF